MTETLHTIVLGNYSDLFAALPHMLGYVPRNALVLLPLHGGRARSELNLVTARSMPTLSEVDALAQQWIDGPLRVTGVGEAILLAVGDPPPLVADAAGSTAPAGAADLRDERATDDGPPGSPPHAEMIARVEAAFREVGVEVVHAAWTAAISPGQPWLCYEPDHTCRGEVADPETSPVGTATTVAGRVTYRSRAELEASLAPEPDEVLARCSAKLDALADRTERERGSSPRPARDGEIVYRALGRTARGAALTEDDLLEVLLAVSDWRVRDLALGAVVNPELAPAALELWTKLVRMAPPPELAEVAALLAVTAYLRGDGALASVALERIERARPDHQLGMLLRRVLALAIPVEDLERIVHESYEDARVHVEEGEPW